MVPKVGGSIPLSHPMHQLQFSTLWLEPPERPKGQTGFDPAIPPHVCGYSTAVSISVFQTEDGGSIPPTRTKILYSN